MNKNLLILGAGQYGYIAKETAEAMECFNKIDFLDDNNKVAISRLNDYKKYSSEYFYAIVAIGNSGKRLELLEKLEDARYRIATLVHPKAYIAPSAQIMKGCIIEPMAVIQSNSVIAEGCLVSAGAVVNHNSVCNLGCHIDCNATIASNTLVPAGSHIACGTVFKNVDISAEQKRPHGPLPINGREYCFEDGM